MAHPTPRGYGSSRSSVRPIEYLRLLKRRWWVLPLAALIGLATAQLTQPERKPLFAFPQPPTYFASHVIVAEPLSNSVNSAVDYDRLALLATTGDAPLNVSRTLQLSAPAKATQFVQLQQGQPETKGTPRGVNLNGATAVAYPSQVTGSLTIVASAHSASRAVAVANALADELIFLLNDTKATPFDASNLQAYKGVINGLNAQRHQAFDRIDTLDRAIDVALLFQAPTLQELERERLKLSNQVVDLDRKLLDTLPTGPTYPVKTLSPASTDTLNVAVPPPPERLVVASGVPRLLTGAGIGALAGIGLLLTLELLRPRVRDIRSAESAAHMPVTAEIPALAKTTRADWYRVVTAEDPQSPFAEAYRALRTSLLAMWPRHPANVNGNGRYNGAGPPLHTLLVTSAGPNEGKSVTVANLAAAFAETGTSVIVIDADTRRPAIHRYFRRAGTPNLGALDADLTPSDLEAVLQDTHIPGVRFAASAPATSPPAKIHAVVKAATDAATRLADLVIIDSPPLLVASVTSELATICDATIFVARADWTRKSSAVHGTDILRRVEARTIGVALVGVEHAVGAEFYSYYYRYSGDRDLRRRLLLWRPGRRARRRSTAPAARTGDGARTVAPTAPTRSQLVDLVEAEEPEAADPGHPDLLPRPGDGDRSRTRPPDDGRGT